MRRITEFVGSLTAQGQRVGVVDTRKALALTYETSHHFGGSDQTSFCPIGDNNFPNGEIRSRDADCKMYGTKIAHSTVSVKEHPWGLFTTKSHAEPGVVKGEYFGKYLFLRLLGVSISAC